MRNWLIATGASVLIIACTLVVLIGRILSDTHLRLEEIPTPPPVVMAGSFTDNQMALGVVLHQDSHGNKIVLLPSGEKYFVNNKGVSFRLGD